MNKEMKEIHKCDKCHTTTENSKMCENPTCPMMPCCGNPVDKCVCNDGKASEVIIHHVDANTVTPEQLAKIPKIVKSVMLNVEDMVNKQRRRRIVRHYTTLVFIIGAILCNSYLAYVYAVEQAFFWCSTSVLFVFVFLYLFQIIVGRKPAKPSHRLRDKYNKK
jgi:hypothetical protein